MTVDQQLDELVTRLKSALRHNLLSVALYGSAATGEFHARHSDLNLFCVLINLGIDELRALAPVLKWWMKRGHPAPALMSLNELRHSADVFAIELLDIKAARRVLHGDDVFADLDVPLHLHRVQVERELRHNTMKLRQNYMLCANDDKQVLNLMLASLSSFTALFRHALLVLGEDPPSARRVAIERLATKLVFPSEPFSTLLDLREGTKRRRDVSIQTLFGEYLEAVQQVTEAVDRHLAGGDAHARN
jgi:hypothetical protein